MDGWKKEKEKKDKICPCASLCFEEMADSLLGLPVSLHLIPFFSVNYVSFPYFLINLYNYYVMNGYSFCIYFSVIHTSGRSGVT